MSFIAFLGCDGSGKSAVIAQLSEKLTTAGVPVTHGHWRPSVFGRTENSVRTEAADDPHGQTPRGKFASLLKLCWLWANWWGAWWRGLRARNQEGVILFDRYHGDLVVDPKRYRYAGPVALARFISRLMPQPDLVFFLDAEPAVLLSRKQEISYEALEKSRTRYLEWVDRNANCRRIDAEKPLDLVVNEVLQHIDNLKNKDK